MLLLVPNWLLSQYQTQRNSPGAFIYTFNINADLISIFKLCTWGNFCYVNQSLDTRFKHNKYTKFRNPNNLSRNFLVFLKLFVNFFPRIFLSFPDRQCKLTVSFSYN